MNIITKLAGRFIGGKLHVCELYSREYDGPLAYAKGESEQEIVPTGPWQPQVPVLDQLFRQAGLLMNSPPPQYPTGPTVASNPNLQQNQNQILNQITQNQSGINQAVGTAQGAATTANPVSGAAQPLTGAMQGGILDLITGNNASSQFGQANTGQASSAINTAVGGASRGVNTAGAPQNAVGNMNIRNELQSSLQGGAMNPFLSQVLDAATRGINRQFEQQTVPGIKDSAIQAGQRGGSSEGIATGMAAQNLQDNVGDITAKIFAQAFDTGAQERQGAMSTIAQANAQNPQLALQAGALNNQSTGLGLGAADLVLQQLMGGTQAGLQAQSAGTAQAGNLLSTGNAQGMNQLFTSLGLIPQLQGAGLNQMGVGNQVGLQLLGQDQAQIDSDISQFFYNQMAPYAQLAQFQNFITGAYGSSVGNSALPQGQPTGYVPPQAMPGAQPRRGVYG